MARRIVALVTHAGLPELAPDDRLLARAIEARGVETHAVVWDDPEARWNEFDAIILRSCWDYHRRVTRFRRWLDQLEDLDASLWNPASIVRWNLSKRYLLELSSVGIPVPETIWLAGDSTFPDGFPLRGIGWKQAVAKPAISANAHNTILIGMDDATNSTAGLSRLLKRGDVVIQEYLPEIATEGEWSLCFVDGLFSHAVLKRPAHGDFRVQARFGGTISARSQVPSLALSTASNVLEHLARPWLYLRIDGVIQGGRFLVLEVELIEPSLFLNVHPAGPGRFAGAVVKRLGGVLP